MSVPELLGPNYQLHSVLANAKDFNPILDSLVDDPVEILAFVASTLSVWLHER